MAYTNLGGQVRVGVRPAVTAQQLQTATYLFDGYGGAAAAYSLRKLSSSYTGSAIRVRRSSDNAEQNIGFDASGNLDTSTLSSFVNPTDSGVTKLLDNYSGASIAYSLRKLSSNYSGSAIRVRRSVDNAEQNIGFDASGNLDTASLTTFVGSGNGFVTTWYDQSGTGNNAFQTSASSQPQIVNNGAVIARNGKPYIESISSRYFQFTNELINQSNGEYSFWITYEKGSGGNQAVLLKNSGNFMWLDYGTQQNFSPFSAVNIPTAHAANTLYLINSIATSSGSTIYRNSLSLNSSGAPGLASATHFPAASFRTAKMTISEFVYYPTNKQTQRVGISTNINGYYSIHGPNSSAFVTTWYDQSGNGRNATQTSSSSQPMILSNGDINLVGGKPSIYFNGSNFISSPYNQGSTNEMYFITQTTDTMYLYPSNNTLINYGFVAQSGNTGGPYANYGTPQLFTNGILKNPTNRDDVYKFLNGYKLILHKNANMSGWTGNPTLFGNYYGGGYDYTGNLQEWLIYPTLQGSQSQIESNINSYYSLWDSSIVQSGLIMNLDAGFKSSYTGSGTTWFDISGSGNNNGTLVNGVGYSSSNGGTLTFDGINDYVQLNNTLTFGTNTFTIEFWINNKYNYTSGNSKNTILSNYLDYNSSWNTYLYIGIYYGNSSGDFGSFNSNGDIFLLNSSGNFIMNSSNTGKINITNNQWTHVSIVRNGNDVSTYKNGVKIATINNSTTANNNYSGSRAFKIGGGVSNSQNHFGDLSNNRIYNRALSDAEVLQNFNATKSRFGL